MASSSTTPELNGRGPVPPSADGGPPSSAPYISGLWLRNSLGNAKEIFKTVDGSRLVKMYICGPTVYAHSHIGHARTYVVFDIIRRILEARQHKKTMGGGAGGAPRGAGAFNGPTPVDLPASAPAAWLCAMRPGEERSACV